MTTAGVEQDGVVGVTATPLGADNGVAVESMKVPTGGK